MKTLKKNNKGFSLVELIVVILIMAIIAVALAPQVMKWVGESKESADANNLAGIKSAVDAAVADYMAEEKTATAPALTFIVNKNLFEADGTTALDTSDADSLEAYIKNTMNRESGQYPYVQAESGKVFKVVVSTTGAVTVTVVDQPTT